MDESEANMSSDSKKMTPSSDMPKPKKRSLVERELETSLTARVTSPVNCGDGTSTSRYGRARRVKTDSDFCNTEKAVTAVLKSPKFDKTPVKSPIAYKMHASNSPVRVESALQNQIENIYSANISLSRFGSDETPGKSPSPAAKKFPKTYVKIDLIQTKEKEETITLIKNMFSPNKSTNTQNNVLERSSEKYVLNRNVSKHQNGYADKASIVKTLDFDSKQKSKNKDVSINNKEFSIKKTLDFDSRSKRKNRETTMVLTKSEIFDLEAKSEYQVGDIAWARMGTYPFWPCIVTREPDTNMFVRKKLFGRIERNMINVTFFGDNGRRSWIVDTMLLKFQGLKEFEATRDQFKPEDKKKDPRLYAAFFISDKKQAPWLKSIEEAESFMKEPKRLRIDLLYDLLQKSIAKQNLKSQKKVTRADSDVSLSESLLDTLFSEDDAKSDDPDRSKKRKSLDVSEVVTACLDNMAARTGLTQIQKQSHMDRWLQKAKSKTPEKSHLEITVEVEEVDEAIEKPKVKTQTEKKISKEDEKSKSSKKKYGPNPVQKPYSLRKSAGESKNLLTIHNEHDYSAKLNVGNCCVKLENIPLNDQVVRTCTPVFDSKDICNEINKDGSQQNDLTNGIVNDQIKPGKSNELVTEKAVEAKNLNSSEMVHTDSSFNAEKFTHRAIVETSNIIENKNEQSGISNNVVRDQIESDISAKIVNLDPENVTHVNVNASERNIDFSFNSKDSDQEAVVDKCDKINISTEQVTKTNFNKISTIESILQDKKSMTNVAHNNICDHNNEIPSITRIQTEQENILEDSHMVNSVGTDLAINQGHKSMFCDSDTSNLITKIPSVNSETICTLSVKAAQKEKESVETNRDNGKKDTKNIATNTDETIIKDDSVTKNDSAKSLSDIKEKLTNGIEFSVEELNEKRENVTEQEVKSDTDVNMLTDNCVAEECENETNDKTEASLPKNIFNQTVEAVADNEDEENKKNNDDLEFDLKNKLYSETNKNRPEIEIKKNNSESNDNDFASEISNDSEVEKNYDSRSEIKNYLGSEIRNNDSESKIQNNYMESKINKKDLAMKIDKNELESKMTSYFKSKMNKNDLKSDTEKNYIGTEKPNPNSVKKGECSVVLVPLNGFIINGYHETRLKDTKEEIFTDSDTASTNSEFDDLSLTELKKRTIAKTRARRNLALNKQNTSENLVDMREINSQSPLPKIVNVSSGEIKINGKAEISAENDDTVVTKRILRPRIETPVESLNPSKESSPDRRIKEVKEEFDSETASITSEGSNLSTKRRGRAKDKANEEDKTKDPEFVRYLELGQDTLIDEHPELSYDEIVAYLYKTWLYEQSCKSDFVKSHDKEQSNLVKGVNPDVPQVKKKKRAKQDKNKLINIDKVFKKELIEEFTSIPSKDKPKRNSSQPCYVEDYSDIEDEIKMFEIFKKEKDMPTTPEILEQKDVATSSSEIKQETVKSPEIKEEKTEEVSPEEYYDEVEAYFEELTKPKPNIFKGLVREKVCEICERTSDLVKCKGCNGMFHIECVKKETDIVDVPVSTRGRKKKKKPRGRRPKSISDSNGLDESHSDEKSQDVSVSEENKSVEEILDEPHIVVADVDNFEAQLAAKMKEMIEVEDKIDYDSYSSDDCLDWDRSIAGKCEIVDFKLKQKTPEIDASNFKCNNCQRDDVPLCFVCKSPVSPKSQINHRQKCQVAHCHKFYHLECLEYWPQTQFSTVDLSKNKGNINEHSEALTCPRHVCHTCVCDDPRGCKTRFSGDKLARCVRCPATYHSFTKCLPAGTQILTASHIICPRHYEHRPGKVPCHVNTGWCFICAQGGTLICCEYCPTSFHAECLQIDPPEGGYMCEDCETGRLPLYGEMVWVKLGHYRWWPGIVLHPYQIPPNIMAVRHSPGEFVVRFFGQYDHYWVNRGRVFPYQEGDSGRISSQKSKIDEAFTKAMEHAQRAYEILKTLEENEEESPDIASSLLPPHYVKLKTNKPHGNVMIKREVEESSLTQCECDPNDEQPCGPMSHCLNRMLLTECGPSCRAGDRCNNRAFERREYPRLTAYRTKHRGWGLKALEDVKAGQFVIEYVGELIDEEEFRRRMRRKHEIRDENFYFLTLDKERMIDAGPKGNLARFMNHCCEPNCETQKWTVLGDIRVGLFALKDIPANSELTFNYNLECAGIEKKRCMCGAKRCSGYIGAKPKQEEKESHKKPKIQATKRPYKKRKPEDIANDKNKPKRPVGRPPKPRELTDIEKDLLIIKNATNGISSDSEGSGRLSSIDAESERKDKKSLKRKRVSFSSEDTCDSKRLKYDEDKTSSEID